MSHSDTNALFGAWSRIVGTPWDPAAARPDPFGRTRHCCEYCDTVFGTHANERCPNCGAPVCDRRRKGR